MEGQRFRANLEHYIEALMHPNEKDHRGQNFANFYSNYTTLDLGGANRIGMVAAQRRGDLKKPQSPFSKLLTSNSKREEVRASIFDAVGLYLGIDMSEGDNLSLRFGRTTPPNERSVEDATLRWMSEAMSVDQVSDGVKAFTGISISLAIGEPKIVVLDEPEAFLHPSLAFKLGKVIGNLFSSSDRHLFLATHSPQILMGLIQSGAAVNIVRLTYKDQIPTARLLPVEGLREMMRDPYLRSANVISALFYDNVIVTEADADRSFYQEINERMLESDPESGISHALFLNANGKDSVHRIVRPLRKLGIPSAAVVDLDVLDAGGATWTNHLTAYNLPTGQHQPLGAMRRNTWSCLNADGRSPKRSDGIHKLRGEEFEAASNLLELVAEYGMYVVDVGEVEFWLSNLSVPRNKTWLHNIFDAMGDDPNSDTYVRPTEGDVWEFINRIKLWLENPTRKGIPQ